MSAAAEDAAGPAAPEAARASADAEGTSRGAGTAITATSFAEETLSAVEDPAEGEPAMAPEAEAEAVAAAAAETLGEGPKDMASVSVPHAERSASEAPTAAHAGDLVPGDTHAKDGSAAGEATAEDGPDAAANTLATSASNASADDPPPLPSAPAANAVPPATTAAAAAATDPTASPGTMFLSMLSMNEDALDLATPRSSALLDAEDRPKVQPGVSTADLFRAWDAAAAEEAAESAAHASESAPAEDATDDAKSTSGAGPGSKRMGGILRGKRGKPSTQRNSLPPTAEMDLPPEIAALIIRDQAPPKAVNFSSGFESTAPARSGAFRRWSTGNGNAPKANAAGKMREPRMSFTALHPGVPVYAVEAAGPMRAVDHDDPDEADFDLFSEAATEDAQSVASTALSSRMASALFGSRSKEDDLVGMEDDMASMASTVRSRGVSGLLFGARANPDQDLNMKEWRVRWSATSAYDVEPAELMGSPTPLELDDGAEDAADDPYSAAFAPPSTAGSQPQRGARALEDDLSSMMSFFGFKGKKPEPKPWQLRTTGHTGAGDVVYEVEEAAVVELPGSQWSSKEAEEEEESGLAEIFLLATEEDGPRPRRMSFGGGHARAASAVAVGEGAKAPWELRIPTSPVYSMEDATPLLSPGSAKAAEASTGADSGKEAGDDATGEGSGTGFLTRFFGTAPRGSVSEGAAEEASAKAAPPKREPMLRGRNMSFTVETALLEDERSPADLAEELAEELAGFSGTIWELDTVPNPPGRHAAGRSDSMRGTSEAKGDETPAYEVEEALLLSGQVVKPKSAFRKPEMVQAVLSFGDLLKGHAAAPAPNHPSTPVKRKSLTLRSSLIRELFPPLETILSEESTDQVMDVSALELGAGRRRSSMGDESFVSDEDFYDDGIANSTCAMPAPKLVAGRRAPPAAPADDADDDDTPGGSARLLRVLSSMSIRQQSSEALSPSAPVPIVDDRPRDSISSDHRPTFGDERRSMRYSRRKPATQIVGRRVGLGAGRTFPLPNPALRRRRTFLDMQPGGRALVAGGIPENFRVSQSRRPRKKKRGFFGFGKKRRRPMSRRLPALNEEANDVANRSSVGSFAEDDPSDFDGQSQGGSVWNLDDDDDAGSVLSFGAGAAFVTVDPDDIQSTVAAEVRDDPSFLPKLQKELEKGGNGRAVVKQAEAALQELQSISRNAPGADEVVRSVSDQLNELGLMYFFVGKHKLAVEKLEEALFIRRQEYGASTQTAETLFNLGTVLKGDQRYRKAANYFSLASHVYDSCAEIDHMLRARREEELCGNQPEPPMTLRARLGLVYF